LLPQPAPFVEVPLGATLDRLVGALDFGRALAGEQAVESGLLARADGGILYVDEVNLLPDHLVDALLDAAAMGRSHVDRDGVSVSHAARFLLVGTMNPEEGELRPQLLDRFGLTVEVRWDQRPHALEALAVQPDSQAAITLLLEQVVRPSVPDLDRPGAVLARRDLTLEVAVLEWVILDVDREMTFTSAERNALRNGPAGERALSLEPEVVMKTARVVSLDHEAWLGRPARLPAERLRRLSAIPLAFVLVQCHGPIVTADATCSLPTRLTMRFFPAQ